MTWVNLGFILINIAAQDQTEMLRNTILFGA